MLSNSAIVSTWNFFSRWYILSNCSLIKSNLLGSKSISAAALLTSSAMSFISIYTVSKRVFSSLAFGKTAVILARLSVADLNCCTAPVSSPFKRLSALNSDDLISSACVRVLASASNSSCSPSCKFALAISSYWKRVNSSFSELSFNCFLISANLRSASLYALKEVA